MKRHFTLIEMLIVVFIIALLAAIGFTVGSSVRKSAMRDAQAAEISKILTAGEMFYNDFGVYPFEMEPEAAFSGGTTAKTLGRSAFNQGPSSATERVSRGEQNFYQGRPYTLALALSMYSVDIPTDLTPFDRNKPHTWYGDYLKKGELRLSSGGMKKPATAGGGNIADGVIIDTYGMPLAYWLHWKDGLKSPNVFYSGKTQPSGGDTMWCDANGNPQTNFNNMDSALYAPPVTNLTRERLTPELWSYGSDTKDGNPNGLRIKLWEAAATRGEQLPSVGGNAPAGKEAADNIGGDRNHVRK
ncbi:MAG: prepilin-type N-terminal cleavage/methylation domain-containing protein [Planctomycetota bacterium]|jgi:prepilin-type N-terminal cleavage/methylation domain-containing protein|nr:prepilin-type N-terminal cleavage/methylation domain-containing protein [Planctomycetota bacterium]